MKAEGLDRWGSHKFYQLQQRSEMSVLGWFSLLGREAEAAGGGLRVRVNVEGMNWGLWPLTQL